MAYQLPYLPPVIHGETRPQDTARYELERSITPMWGREGIQNAKNRRKNKRMVGKEMLSLAEQARIERLQGNQLAVPERALSPKRMSVPEAPPAGYRQAAPQNQGIFNYSMQQQQQQQQRQQVQPQRQQQRQPPPQQQQELQQQQRPQWPQRQQRQFTGNQARINNQVPAPANQRHLQPQPSQQPQQSLHLTVPRMSIDLQAHALDVELDGSSETMARMMVEERTKRKLQQAELERLSALAHRNDAAIKDRTAFLEKLRLRDTVELRELRERLRTVESEMGVSRASGHGGLSNGGSNNQRSSPGASPTARGVLPAGSKRGGLARSSSTGNVSFNNNNNTNNSKDSSALILNELRLRDDRDNAAREKQEQRRLELWQHNMTLQKRVEEQRQQMSEFALRSADRISALESRLNERDQSIVRLEQKNTGTSQQLANTEIQTEATLSSVVSSLEHLQNKLAREIEMRAKSEEKYQTENSELRRLLFSTEKGIAATIESSVEQLWEKDANDRSRSKQVREFVEQRYLHERDSIYQWAERLESTIASERNDRLRFEKELRQMTNMKVSALEAMSSQSKTTNEITGNDIRDKTENVLTKMVGMITSYKENADEQRTTHQRTVHKTVSKLRQEVKILSGTTGGTTTKLEDVLRAEIRTRERKNKEMYEAAVEREKEIDHRARAVEASLRASVDGFDARIRSVEERVNSALAGFRAQMENDIKMSTDSMAKMLLDLDGSVQMLSIRIDSNDAERRSSLGQFKSKLNEVRRMTVSRAELDTTTEQVKQILLKDIRNVSKKLNEFNEDTNDKLNKEETLRSNNDKNLQESMAQTMKRAQKTTTDTINALQQQMVNITDKERTERILKDSKHADMNQSKREELLLAMKKLILNNTKALNETLETSQQNQQQNMDQSVKALKNQLGVTVDEKLNALQVRTKDKLDQIIATTGTLANEAKTNADEANKNANTALSNINNVVETSTTQLKALSTELRTIVNESATKQSTGAVEMKQDVSSRLVNIESALRRSFEEQASSLRALTQANLAAEASVRLREDTRVRKEVDLRLKEQQKWVGEFTDYKTEKMSRKLGQLVRAEALARQSSTRQVHREIAYEMDKSSAKTQVRSCLDSMIGQLVERDTAMNMKHALKKIASVTTSVDKKIQKEINKQSKETKKHLAQHVKRMESKFTKAKRDTNVVHNNVEVKAVLNNVINQIVEENSLKLLKDTTSNIMQAEVTLTKLVSHASSRQSHGLKEQLNLMKESFPDNVEEQLNLIKESIEEEREVRGTEDKRMDVANRNSQEEVNDALKETKDALKELKERVENYHSGGGGGGGGGGGDDGAAAEEEPTIEWEEHQDEDSGQKYWKDPVSGRQTYEDPT